MNYKKRKHACGSFILLPSTFILSDRRVPPGECGFTSSDGDPGTNGVISKTRGGAWNKGQFRVFASEVFGRARPTGAPSPACEVDAPLPIAQRTRQYLGSCGVPSVKFA